MNDSLIQECEKNIASIQYQIDELESKIRNTGYNNNYESATAIRDLFSDLSSKRYYLDRQYEKIKDLKNKTGPFKIDQMPFTILSLNDWDLPDYVEKKLSQLSCDDIEDFYCFRPKDFEEIKKILAEANVKIVKRKDCSPAPTLYNSEEESDDE